MVKDFFDFVYGVGAGVGGHVDKFIGTDAHVATYKSSLLIENTRKQLCSSAVCSTFSFLGMIQQIHVLCAAIFTLATRNSGSQEYTNKRGHVPRIAYQLYENASVTNSLAAQVRQSQPAVTYSRQFEQNI